MTLGTGHTTASMAQLIRSEVWSSGMKEVALDDMRYMSKFIKNIGGEFTDGDVFTIPSKGQLDIFNYTEDTPIQMQAMDTGEFNFSITEYKGAGTYITQKARQDLHYAAALEASFVPEQTRALMSDYEAFMMRQGQPGTPNGQTVANLNTYNGADHRWVGMGTRNSQRVLSPEDFSRARYALKKANMPLTNLVAIVDPIQASVIETHPNFINFSNSTNIEGLITTGLSSGFRWVKNVFGFDVYESNYLAKSGTGSAGASETIGGVASGTDAVTNLFFSANSSFSTWIGAWRQMPKVDTLYRPELQREEYYVTARYGGKLYYPENLVTVLTGSGSIW